MKTFPALVFTLVLVVGCSPTVDLEREKEGVLKADRDFSELSINEGMYEAFDRYMTDNAVILRDSANPVTGREEIRKLFPTTAPGTLKWEPMLAEVSGSADMAYTIGRWDYSSTDTSGNVRTSSGHYITIWRKQADGSWKYVFDTGTEGVAAESQEM